jgi:transcriptional regulator with GAF, ATPase, and Fis domain
VAAAVARTRQSVILDDAGAENPFVSDPYIRQWHARSVLCLPLVKQAALVGVLYLENNLAPRVFTPARVELLTLLASQAMISLENARLYSELREAEQKLRRHEGELRQIIDLVPHHIGVYDPEGARVWYANRVLAVASTESCFGLPLGRARLNVFPIEMPPLRERTTDIPLLVASFVDRYASKAGKTIRHVDKRTLDLVRSYRWPGNVRELQNVIECAGIVSETDTLVVDENWLPREAVSIQPPTPPLSDVLVAREREMIEAALAETRGKVSGPSGAAAKLGLPASTLESKIRTLGDP